MHNDIVVRVLLVTIKIHKRKINILSTVRICNESDSFYVEVMMMMMMMMMMMIAIKITPIPHCNSYAPKHWIYFTID